MHYTEKTAPNCNSVVELCTMNNTEREGEGRIGKDKQGEEPWLQSTLN